MKGYSMNRRLLIKSSFLGLASVAVSGCANLAEIAGTGLKVSEAVGYSPSQLTQGVKEVLTLSTERASASLGGNGGFTRGTTYRMRLPSQLGPVIGPMRKFGLGSYIDTLEDLMNRGAQKAAKEAGPVFVQAIGNMNVVDAIGILRGDADAATQYFRSETEQALRGRYQSLLKGQLDALGFYGDYKKLLKAYQVLPVANKPDLDLENHAINAGLNALFAQIAEEEKKIRSNPVEQGSILISSIMSSLKG